MVLSCLKFFDVKFKFFKSWEIFDIKKRVIVKGYWGYYLICGLRCGGDFYLWSLWEFLNFVIIVILVVV